MITYLSRIYIILLIFASLIFSAASPATRDYVAESFNTGDGAYHFYDDFPTEHPKSIHLFQWLSAASLWLLYQASDRERFAKRRAFEAAAYVAGAGCILFFWQSAIVVILLLSIMGFSWSDSAPARSQTAWILAALFVFSLLLRMEKLPNVMNQPLQPDSVQYVSYSQECEGFYATHHREPLWAWVNYGLSRIFPVPDDVAEHGYIPIRLTTIFLSSAGVLLAYLFGKRWISHRVGLAAALLMTVNKALIYRSLQGLRLELLILAVFALLWLSWTSPSSKKAANGITIGLGLTGAILLLLRTSCLPIVFFCFAWSLWSGKQSLKQILTASAICLLPVMPYYAYCWMEYGDPLYSGNAHIRFYYKAILGEYPPDGQRISPFQFMFQIFSWYETAFYTAAGVVEAFWGRYALRLFYLPFSVFLVGCSAAGYLHWLRTPERRILAISALLLLGPMAFFLGILIKSPTVFDWRLVAHLFPFMAYAAAEGFFFLVQKTGWIGKTGRVQ
ncbi:MAG: hypothetical protein JXR73_17060 [Candidatus Omnitrophica bacterium]|nr:hypothetical protein [Candidatus Omnitrophota bacterium]